MDAALIASGTAVGAVAGAVLDPVGQRLADRSRQAEERRRQERADRQEAEVRTSADGQVPPTDGAGRPAAPVPVPELDPPGPGSPAADRVDGTGRVDGTEDEPVVPEPVRHLLPSGRSVPRTVGAAVFTAALCGLAVARYTGPGHTVSPWVAVPFGVFLAMAVTVSVTDLTHRLVPRQLLFGALVVIVPYFVVLSAHLHEWRPLVDAAVAGAGAFAVFFVIWFAVPRGMGFGDVRLAGVIGVTVGYLDLLHAYLAFLIGFVLGLVFGLVLMAVQSSGRRTRIPFAPALCAGAAITILWGGPLVRHLFHAS